MQINTEMRMALQAVTAEVLAGSLPRNHGEVLKRRRIRIVRHKIAVLRIDRVSAVPYGDGASSASVPGRSLLSAPVLIGQDRAAPRQAAAGHVVRKAVAHVQQRDGIRERGDAVVVVSGYLEHLLNPGVRHLPSTVHAGPSKKQEKTKGWQCRLVSSLTKSRSLIFSWLLLFKL